MNDKTLQILLAGWSDSEFAVAASGEYCEDLKSRIEGVSAAMNDKWCGDGLAESEQIAFMRSRIEALEAEKAQAAKAERDRIVAWLREHAKSRALGALESYRVLFVADALEGE